MYPNANIWLIGADNIGLNLYYMLTWHCTGHSLGGALASLLGSTFGAPVVAFEAPGERMAASRLHLPMPVRALNTSIIECDLE